jgi:myo-inositol-1(or 4)-monophosphatase
MASQNFGTTMDRADLDRKFHMAKGLVREVGQQALAYYRDRASLGVERKGLQDLVSRADRECEDIIVESLRSRFPEDGFLGEERGRQNPGSETIWVIDPIDGTANFLRGIPNWCVSLGYIEGREPIAGVIYNPVTDELYAARKGGGATMNDHEIHVSSTRSLDEARMGIGFSYRRSVDVHVAAMKALLDAHCEYNRFGSGALGMAMAADGRLDGYWEAHINIWDVAAGLCLVKEAGGWHNDFMQGDVFVKGNPILAATPGLAKDLAKLLPTLTVD